jgi:thiamine kinase-like enzyme
VHDYIRADDCAIPKHLREMIIETDTNAEEIFNRIERLPIVLCHRDFWVANIFCANDKIVLLDWDTTGWGYLGEDIASLIADEANVELMAELYSKCVPAYYNGFSEYADVSHIKDRCVREMILVYYGYRLVEWYLNAESPEGKVLQIDTLQKIYEMKETTAL